MTYADFDPQTMLRTLLTQRAELDAIHTRAVHVLERARDVVSGNLGQHSDEDMATIVVPVLTYVLGPLHVDDAIKQLDRPA